jgi:hypothetical protein
MTSHFAEGMRRPTVAARKYILGVSAALLLLSAVGCQAPISRDVLQQLPESQARELQVYSTNHAVLFDLRIHSLDTCPFLSYMPNETFMDHKSKDYAIWLHHFFSKKHEEEQDWYHCTCVQELSASPKPAAPAKAAPAAKG